MIELARSRENALDSIGTAAKKLSIPPVSVVVFGSFARREADQHSDIDIVIVRPDGVDEDDPTWNEGVEWWREQVRGIAGNPVEIIEAGRAEASEKLSSRRTLWRHVARDGVLVHGESLDELRCAAHA